MGVHVTSKISGTIICPECGYEIDVSNPATKSNQSSNPSKSNRKNKISWNWIGWSVIIAILFGILINQLAK